MRYLRRPRRAALIGSVALATVLSLTGAGLAIGSPTGVRPGVKELRGADARAYANIVKLRADAKKIEKASGTSSTTSGVNSGAGDSDLADSQNQYDFERTAPAGYVTGPALADAMQQASQLPETGGHWRLFTNKPDDAQPSNYTDPFWGNQGAGWSTVSGRVTALVAAPDGAWFLGAADGGVWRSWNQGQTWHQVFDNMPTLSIGALAIDPVNGSLWVGTGEANESADSYAGTGTYVSYNDGDSFHLVGAVDGVSPLASRTTFRIAFDQHGNAYAATNNGLFRYSAQTRQWTEVLDPAGPVDNPPYDQQVTDVAVVPGTHGHDVIAAIGWHGAGNTQNNGFYESTDSGHTFSEVTLTGAINASDIGRTTFAYSADGTKLYAIVQSVSMLAAGDESALQGIFVSSGSPASVAGPWKLIGDEDTLAASGSALGVGSGYGVGVQAWYNQTLAVDPNNPDHVYAGLEEMFESTNGGQTWVAASPYWNYTLPCESTNTCPNTTHPDQHALMITDGKVVIGNDGGVYSRPLSDDAEDGQWTDLNATLRTLQYYDARAGSLPGGGIGDFGGMQDNGSAVYSTGSTEESEAAGGDGTDVVVDPNNANNIAGEYVYGTLYSSTDGGHSFADFLSPTCIGQEEQSEAPFANCDPGARFVTPFVQDQQNPDVWVLGGQDVWVSTAGWNTTCTSEATCSWQDVYNTGTGNEVTALSSADNGSVIYAGWVGGGGNPGPSFAVGIATNYGGTWHEVNMTGLPSRYIAGVTVDPRNPAHAYAIFNGYSRRFVPGGGVGHVFETWNGGQTWTDISGNLPDIPGDALVLLHHRLALATDGGVFTAREGEGASTNWSRLGHGLPNVVVDDLTLGPNDYIYAATHGRGIWRIRF